jgi:hypothetical protein
MVVIQLTHSPTLATVLAFEPITSKNVDAGELDALFHRGNGLLQLHNSWDKV